MMNRHTFIRSFSLPFMALCSGKRASAMGGDKTGRDYGASADVETTVEKLGDMPLAKLIELHRRELDEYAAHWDTGGIDWEYGGFIPRWDENGKFTTDVKDMYYLGRGLWVFSYLYNHAGQRERHLKAARLCWDFMLKHCRDTTTGYWLSKVSRDGKPLEGPYDIYGDMYVVQGLTEYSRASGDRSLLDIAIETAHGINERILSPAYQHIKAHKNGFSPGTRILGTWQHFLGALTPLARETGDYSVDMMARMCSRNIMERHFSREYGVFFEYLDDRYEPFTPGIDDELRKVSSWHGVQAAWMCMDDALRRGDRSMFCDALDMGRRTLESCWREENGDGLIGLDNPEQHVADSSDTTAWERHDDALVYALLSVEHTHAPWAIAWSGRLLSFIYANPERKNLRSLLHYPRRLFFAIEILDRMIARHGKVSDFLEGQ